MFVGPMGRKAKGSFQCIVLASSADQAWDIAIQHECWQQLPFDVEGVEIFPRDVLTHG